MWSNNCCDLVQICEYRFVKQSSQFYKIVYYVILPQDFRRN